MPSAALVCALFSALILAQDPKAPEEKGKLPQKGDTIVVKGCVSGSTIQDVDSGLTYRLKGGKDLVKRLGKEHSGHVDEVTGVLKSELRMGGTKSKRVGRTTISIGAAESRTSGIPQELNPVLEVKSMEHLPGTCVR